MGKAVAFDAKLIQKKGNFFPKKILTHEKIPINATYSFTVSIWIADTPQSNKKPTINLVLSHANGSFRLCFNSVTDLVETVNLLKSFILGKALVVNTAYTEALKEFFEHHERRRMQDLNDNTDSTVIQDISESKYRGRKRFVNTQTGEIIQA